MATSDDEESVSNIDFSVISSSIDLGRPMLDQVVNSIHYGSPEIRNLLRNECDLIIECKICRNFFRSFPNFVAHKRVYCLEMNADKIYNDRLPTALDSSHSDTVVVEPTAPEEAQPAASQQTTVIERLVNGSFQGTSSAFRLYSDVAERIERQKDHDKNTVVTMTPIASNPNAVTVSVTQNKNRESCDLEKSQEEDSGAPSMLRNILERPLPAAKDSQSINQDAEEKTKNCASVEEKRRESSRRSESRKPMEDLRPVQSNLGNANRSFLSALSKRGLCHIKTLECLVCKKQMSSKKTLWNHMKFFHLGEKTVYPCLFCDKTFGRFYNTSKHIMSCHNKTHADIEKLKTRIKLMSYKAHDDSEEESTPPSLKNMDTSKNGDAGSQSGIGIEINNCEGCGKAFWKKAGYMSHRKQCKALNPSIKIKESKSTIEEKGDGRNSGTGDGRKQQKKKSPAEVRPSSESSPDVSGNLKSDALEVQSQRPQTTRNPTTTNQDTYMKTRFLDKRRAVQYESPKKSSASSTENSPKPSPSKGVSPKPLHESTIKSHNPEHSTVKHSPRKSGSASESDSLMETDDALSRTPAGRNLTHAFETIGTRSKSKGRGEKEQKDISSNGENAMQTRMRRSREDQSRDGGSRSVSRDSSADSLANKQPDQRTPRQKYPSTSSNTSRESIHDRFIHTRKSKQLLETKKEVFTERRDDELSDQNTKKDVLKSADAVKKTRLISECPQKEEGPLSTKIMNTESRNGQTEEGDPVKLRQKMTSPNKHIFAIQGKVSEDNSESEKEGDTVSIAEKMDGISCDTENEETSRSRRKQVISVRQFDEVDGAKGTPVTRHNTRRSSAQRLSTVSPTGTRNTRAESAESKNKTSADSRSSSADSKHKTSADKNGNESSQKKKIKNTDDNSDSKEKDNSVESKEKRLRLRSKADWNSPVESESQQPGAKKKEEEKPMESQGSTMQTRRKTASTEGQKLEEDSANITYSAIQPKAHNKMRKNPNTSVVKIQEIWVKKKPGQPTEEVKSSTITVRNTSTAQKRLGERYRHPRRVYVMKSKKSTKPVCLDMSNIDSLLDRVNKQCRECGIQLKSMSNLRRHIVRHLGWKRYKCKLCTFSSFNRSECNSHLQRIHQDRISGKDINYLIKDLKKEGTEKRLQKKQQTMRIKQKLESEMGGSNTYKKDTKFTTLKTSPLKSTPANQPVKSIITTRRSSQIHCTPEAKPVKSPIDKKTPENSKKSTPVELTGSCPRIDENARKCKDCNISFSTNYNLFRHVRNIHKFDTSLLKKPSSTASASSLQSPTGSKKSAAVQDDTASVKSASSEKSTRKRKHNDSGEFTDLKLQKTDVDKYAPTGRKRSASLDGSYNANDNANVNDDLYDNLCSVSDNENDFSDRIGSPTRSEEGGMMRLEPRVQTMFAALEEARATVRQRGKKMGIRRLSSPVKKMIPSPTEKITPVRSSARLNQDSKDSPSASKETAEGQGSEETLLKHVVEDALNDNADGDKDICKDSISAEKPDKQENGEQVKENEASLDIPEPEKSNNDSRNTKNENELNLHESDNLASNSEGTNTCVGEKSNPEIPMECDEAHEEKDINKTSEEKVEDGEEKASEEDIDKKQASTEKTDDKDSEGAENVSATTEKMDKINEVIVEKGKD